MQSVAVEQKNKYILNGLNCANCASKIEQTLQKQEGMDYAALNFAAKSIYLKPEHVSKAQQIIDSIEPGVTLEAITEAKPNNKEDKSHIKKQLATIGVSSILLLIGMLFNAVEYAVLIPAYLLVGWRVVLTALRNITKGNVFDENFLMTIATVGAIAINQLPEAVGVMLFYNVGELFQELAVNRSRNSIKALMDIKPEYANLMTNGNTKKVNPETVNIDDIIIVKPGEKIPLDGVVLEGSSFLDTSALTGESVPRKVRQDDEVLAGMINTNGLLNIKATRIFANSSVAKILDLVENAGTRKASTEKFITKFSRYYTPAVVLAAVALAVVPPLLIPNATFSDWLYRALTLLVISCPCALVVSIPLGYFAGIGSASKKGILIKGANFLEALTDVNTVVFDKTGTLTKGVFRVTKVKTTNSFAKEDVLKYATIAETNSNHPIAKSIIKAYGDTISEHNIEEYQEIAGHGIKAKYAGKIILAGNQRLMQQENIKHESVNADGTMVYIAVDGVIAGYITISDEIKEDSAKAIAKLNKIGIKNTIMLTGDDAIVAERVSAKLGIDKVFAKLLPEDKVTKLEEIIASLSGKEKLAFVGDGINDAPVLTRADVGIAMGGLGSDAAIEAADVVIMDDQPAKIATAVGIAQHTRKIIIQNIVMALGIKGAFVLLGSLGVATMWEAVFADVGVTILAVLNSARALKYNEVN